MSLIEEALRQIQLEAQHPGKTAPPPPKAQRPSAPEAPSKPIDPVRVPRGPSNVTVGPWIGFFATVGGSAALLLLGLWLGALWNGQGRQAAVVESQPVPVRAARPHAEPATVSVVAPTPIQPIVRAPHLSPPKSSPPKLELQGVVEGGGEPIIVVNGRIVRLGETVDGATLLDVRDSVARFRWQDKELVLQTSR